MLIYFKLKPPQLVRKEFAKIIALKITTPTTAANGCHGIGGFSSAVIIAGGTKIIHDSNASIRLIFKVLLTFNAVALTAYALP
ncbi:MAG: hypothetical protein IJG32_07255 [Selenomonadaceae bacterium]|nr:hypothetical protein [Selenomonadaceae bacterium]